MKLDSEEFSFIKSIIQENKFIDKDQIFVLPFFKTLMEHVEKNKITLNKRDNAIKQIIKCLPKSQNISIQKITEKFKNTVEFIKNYRKVSPYYNAKKIAFVFQKNKFQEWEIIKDKFPEIFIFL